MEGLVDEEQEFEQDALLHRAPVELMKDGGNVFSGVGGSEKAASRILNVL